jgi:hypothetical protein
MDMQQGKSYPGPDMVSYRIRRAERAYPLQCPQPVFISCFLVLYYDSASNEVMQAPIPFFKNP